MDPRRLSPIDHIDHCLLDAFVQKSLPEVLGPLQATLIQRMPHPCQLVVLWLDETQTAIASRIDTAGRRVEPGEHDPRWVDHSPTLTHCLKHGTPIRHPGLDDPLMAWAAGDTCRPLICFPVRRGPHALGFLLVMHQAGKPPSDSAEAELMAWLPALVALMAHEIDAIHGLFGAVRFARDFTLMRDTETGQHQLRLGAFAGHLARSMSRAHGMNETFAPQVALYAPLHDIGKIGIPDEILLKPGKFDDEERERMKAHVTKGIALIDRLIEDFALSNNSRIDILRGVVACHHEYLDGSGYPHGLAGDTIPLAARIITVSDIFDALTNVRAYKKRWSLDEAFALLRRMAGKQLDKECVRAFISERKHIANIWQHFAANGV
jgi:HD-GYP domain-containing protein (c-di-GMP phosphodiesterase class II)